MLPDEILKQIDINIYKTKLEQLLKYIQSEFNKNIEFDFEFRFDNFSIELNRQKRSILLFHCYQIYENKNNKTFLLIDTHDKTSYTGIKKILDFIKFNDKLKEFEEYAETKYEEILLKKI